MRNKVHKNQIAPEAVHAAKERFNTDIADIKSKYKDIASYIDKVFDVFLYTKLFRYEQTEENKQGIIQALKNYDYAFASVKNGMEYKVKFAKKIVLYFENFSLPELNLQDNRDKQIKEILDLGINNKYAIKLYNIYLMELFEGITKEDIYIMVNSLLGEYYFNVIMPYEDAKLAKQRNEVIGGNGSDYENISGVPVYNPADKAEVAIKNNILIGQIFKSLKEIYSLVGLDNLGVKSLDGGKQKQIAYETLCQYTDLQEIEGRKRAKQVVDIYEIPHLIEKEDGRGKGGFYIDRIVPIMVNYLSCKTDTEILCNVNQLSKIVGIVGENFKSISYEQLAEINPKFTHAMINQFYYRCKPEQEEVIFRVLDKLQNDYSVISYYKNFRIVTDDGEIHTSSKQDDIIIRQTQRKVLKEFGAKRILTIYQRKQEKRFFARVCELINEIYDLHWIGYHQQIQIFVDAEGLQEIAPQFILDEITLQKNKAEVAQRFSKRIENRTLKDIQSTNSKADIQIAEWESDFEQSEVKELVDLGFDYAKEIKEMKPEPYKFHDNYKEIQRQLITILLGVPQEQF